MERFHVELRAGTDGNRLTGHAAVFGTHAELPGHYETMAPGAFDATLKAARDIKALWNHDMGAVLGSTKAGTLRLDTDERGLAFEVDLPDTSYARDLRALVERGDVNGMSFGFLPGEDRWSRAADGRQLRTHTSVKRLYEISAVSIPAYEGTEVFLRHLDIKPRPTSLATQLIRLRAARYLEG